MHWILDGLPAGGPTDQDPSSPKTSLFGTFRFCFTTFCTPLFHHQIQLINSQVAFVTRLSKMLAVRSFAAPARRQCFQASARTWVPVSSQIGRQYATAVKEKGKVAEFHGKKGSDGLYTVSLIEGDGIGPEISQSVKDIFTAAKVCTSRKDQLIERWNS